jgi:hypothetical protein
VRRLKSTRRYSKVLVHAKLTLIVKDNSIGTHLKITNSIHYPKECLFISIFQYKSKEIAKFVSIIAVLSFPLTLLSGLKETSFILLELYDPCRLKHYLVVCYCCGQWKLPIERLRSYLLSGVSTWEYLE